MAEEFYEENEKTFEGDYLVIDLAEEYGPAYTGKERFAVASDLSEGELLALYADELKPYIPFLMITKRMYGAFMITATNNERERKRDALYHDAFALESGSPPIEKQLDTTARCESANSMECILKKMRTLPDRQRTRLYKKYILGYSTKEIAEQEGVEMRAVRATLQRGRKEMLDIFTECGVAS